MTLKTCYPVLVGVFFLAFPGVAPRGLLNAQQPLPATTKDPPPAAVRLEPTQNGAPPCIQPAPMVEIGDYNGPFQKVVGFFARPLERKSVHAPHFLPGEKMCTLNVKDKFVLFLHSSIDPVAFLDAGFNAGLDQAQNSDPSYHQGTLGYARRFGAELAGETSSRLFSEFAYPAIFHEDPRYYRKVHGPAGRRLLHAVSHSVLAHRDNGNVMFNFSEWLGTSSSVVLSNTYHPDNKRGFAPAATRVGYSVLQDVGFDVLREFWPDISRALKLPFRGQSEPAMSNSNPNSK